MPQTYKQWFSLVNQAVAGKIGLSAMDLPDCPYRDWFNDGMEPAEAALEAMRNADVPEELMGDEE